MISRQTGIVLGAVWASVGVHTAALVGFGLLIVPDPVEHKPMPKSQMNIQSQEVKRVKARANTAGSEQLNESTPTAQKAEQSQVKQSTARPVILPRTSITAQAPVPVKAVSRVAKTEPVRVRPVEGATIIAVATSSPSLAAKAPQAKTATAVVAAAQALQNVGLPRVIAKNIEPKEQAASTASLPLPAIKGTASLAWVGGADDHVEATSLAAIQAFMQPGDIDQSDSNIGNLRDGLSAILASVPCARLQTTFIPETGTLELRGHIPDDALRGPVLAALSDQIGEAIRMSDQLLILPRPQCGALSGIADVGLPQSTEQLTNPRVIGENGFAQNYTYTDGQRLELDLIAPDYDSYVYVDYFAADGSVIHLQPNDTVPVEFVAAKTPLSVGRDRGDKPSLDITVSPPFGQEIAAAFATSQPLYDGVRPLQEPAGPYLDFLKNRVTEMRTHDLKFKGEWVYFFISTKAQ